MHALASQQLTILVSQVGTVKAADYVSRPVVKCFWMALSFSALPLILQLRKTLRRKKVLFDNRWCRCFGGSEASSFCVAFEAVSSSGGVHFVRQRHVGTL